MTALPESSATMLSTNSGQPGPPHDRGQPSPRNLVGHALRIVPATRSTNLRGRMALRDELHAWLATQPARRFRMPPQTLGYVSPVGATCRSA
jgi:hypothetical protein